MEMAGLDRSRRWKIADLGCGTGASTLLLASRLDAEITAVDRLPAFLDELEVRATSQGVARAITPLNCSMEALPFAEGAFDVIWSEGAVYNMGFEAGISAWRRFLKPDGMLIVSEITWLRATRPPEIQSYWQSVYPEIDVASAKIRILEQHGYRPEGFFILPAYCWLENYYRPMQRRFPSFLARHGHSQPAQALVAAEEHEIALYERYRDDYGYGVYVARKG